MMMRGFATVLPPLMLVSAADGTDARGAGGSQALCSLSGGPPPFSIARTQDIVAASTVIVRATALGEGPPPPESTRPDATHVMFDVNEVLRGSDVPDTLRFMGVIRNEDAVPPELVEEEVPHRSYIRRAGGDCLAMTYQQGGQYLLLLERAEERGVLDPYWELLAPTNNQIRGAADQWLGWVRAEIARNPPDTPEQRSG